MTACTAGAMAIVLFGAITWSDHRSTLDRAWVETENAGQLLAEQVNSAFVVSKIITGRLIDNIRMHGIEYYRHDGWDDMVEMIDKVPQVGSAWVLDGSCRLVANTLQRDPAPADFSDRPYCRPLREGADTHVGELLFGRISKIWFFSYNQAVRVDGRFLGIAQTSMHAEFFARVFTALGLPPESQMSIYRQDGALVMRSPLVPEDLGVNAAATPLFREHIAAHPAGRLNEEISGGEPRLLVYRVLLGQPVVVTVSVSRAQVLKPFQGRLIRNSSLLALVLALFAGLAVLATNMAQRGRQAEEALRDSEERYRTISDLSPDAILVNLDGRFVYANRAAQALLAGGALEQLLGRSPFELIEPEYRPAARDRISRLLREGGGAPPAEQVWRRPDGSLIDVEVAAGFIYWQRRPAVQVLVRDVTERKRSEAALRQSEALYRSLASNLPQGAAFVVNRDLRYVLAEGEALRTVGLTPSDLEGKTLDEALPPELARRYERHYRQVLAGRPFRREHESHGRHFVSHGVPLRGHQGDVAAALVVSYDISDRKEVELRLRASEERTRLALQAAHAGAWEFAPATGAITWSSENYPLFGMDPAQGPPDQEGWFERCVHPEDREALQRDYQAVVARGGPTEFTFEFRFIHPERGLRWISAPGRIDREADGSARRVLGLNLDVTERKQAEEALRRSEALARARAEEIEAVYDAAPIGIALFDRDFRFLRINERLAQINGTSAAEHVGRAIEELLPDETVSALRAIQPPLLSAEEVTDLEITGPDHVTGEETTWLVSYRGLLDEQGAVQQILGTVLDITGRRKAETALRERTRQAVSAEQLLEALMRYVPEGIAIATAPDVTIVRVSDYGSRLLGRPRAQLEDITVEAHVDAYKVFHAGTGAIARPEELPLTRAVRDGEIVVNEEWLVAAESGEHIPILCNAGPIRDEKAHVVGGVIAWRDITDLKAAQDRQRLLLGELNHRVKNTLATVQAIANQTFQGDAATKEARRTFGARILGLARAHDLLTRSNWHGAALRDVVLEALTPFDDVASGRFDISGEDVPLPSKAALAFSMAVHELATNAVKYGALSSSSGRVGISWHIQSSGGADRLLLSWRESGGPPVRQPERRGFGSMMIERVLAQELNANVALDYAPEGLNCRLDMPRPSVGTA